ncbi:MAG: hypothetical protein ACOYEK_05050 [bacterium]|jgi:uncharacterized membrane protein YkvI
MEKSAAKKGLPAFIGVAAVWMGTHFGPGLASGTQINVYYVNYGIPGICVTALAMGLLGYVLYCSMEFSRIYKTYDYHSWTRELYGTQWAVYLFDLIFLVTILTALGGSLNAVAVLLENFVGLNYWVGVSLVIACGMLLCAYGAELVRRASTYMMFLIGGILLVIMLLVVIQGDPDLAGSIANQRTNLPTVSWGAALWSAVIYASFQATVVANIASVADTLEDRAASKKAALTGWIGNTVFLLILGLTLFSYTNVYNITAEALPFFSILQRLGYDWLSGVYITIVFVAVLSTVVGFSFAGVARFSKYYRSKEEGANHSLRDGLFVGALLLGCAAASRFGIVALVSVGYRLLGYLNLPIIMLPAIILGGKKISKEYLRKEGIKAPGVSFD